MVFRAILVFLIPLLKSRLIKTRLPTSMKAKLRNGRTNEQNYLNTIQNTILLKDILAFFLSDYRDAFLITLYFVVLGISNLKIRSPTYLLLI